jgi:hypothetical protein
MNAHSTLTHERTGAPQVGTDAPGRTRWAWLPPRFLGALALVVVGAVHLQQYLDSYSAIPTIGTLFLVNFVAAVVLSAALLVPLEHLAGRRAGGAVALVTAAGIALCTGSLVMLMISQRTPLFGFQEPGYDPTAIALARNAEIAAVVLLVTSLVVRFATRGSKVRW